MTFNIIFRELRKEKNLTQGEIAKLLNTKQTSISSWENTTCQPPIETLIQIANFFGVSLDYLCGKTTNIFFHDEFQNTFPKDERQLVARYRKLPPDLKNKVCGYIDALGEILHDR